LHDWTIESLYFAMYEKLFLFAFSHLKDYHRSEELVHDVFVLAQEKWEAVINSPNPNGWLYIALKNMVGHEFRKRQLIFKKIAEMSYLEEVTQAGNNRGDIDELLALEMGLEQDEWILLKKVYYEGYSIHELSEQLGIEYETCKKRIQRIKSKAKTLK